MPDIASHRRYRPLLELGRGRISRAYLAESLASGVQKLVVIKVLNHELCSDAEARASFLHEAGLSAYLNHPNTGYVFEVGEHDGAPMVVMEYLDGVPLTRILSHAGYRLNLPLRVHILTQVLAGLHHFHELKDFEGNALQAVHCDVSPHNVIVLHEGGIKLVGFGSARAAHTPSAVVAGSAEGKVHYMPPEQVLGQASLDRRADVYAVGVMLWEAIARRPMWKGRDRAQIERALANGEVPSLREAAPDAPKALARVVTRALSPNRDARYASAQVMQVALERAARETVGVGQMQDLVEFMDSCFGLDRYARRQVIAQVVQRPVGADDELSQTRPTWSVRASKRVRWGWVWSPHAAVIAGVVAMTTGGVVWARGAQPSRAQPARVATNAVALASAPGTHAADAGHAHDEPREHAPEATLDRPSRERAASTEEPAPAKSWGASAPFATSGPTTAHCNPPFRLTDDGVRWFKAECF